MSVEVFDSIVEADGDVYSCALTSNNDDVGRCIAVTGGAINVTVYSECNMCQDGREVSCFVNCLCTCQCSIVYAHLIELEES